MSKQNMKSPLLFVGLFHASNSSSPPLLPAVSPIRKLAVTYPYTMTMQPRASHERHPSQNQPCSPHATERAHSTPRTDEAQLCHSLALAWRARSTNADILVVPFANEPHQRTRIYPAAPPLVLWYLKHRNLIKLVVNYSDGRFIFWNSVENNIFHFAFASRYSCV